jgi:hypothetical protein
MLAPTVIGFFEFTFMRLHKDLPNKKLADLLSVYMYEDSTFAHNAFRGETQIGRTLVHESTLKEELRTEILPYEQASEILKNAELRAVGLCYCRHKAMHHGTPCKKPMEVCTSLNGSADWVIRRGFGRKISAEEALDIAAMTRDQCMVHVADNVKNDVSYICHSAAAAADSSGRSLRIGTCTTTSSRRGRGQVQACARCVRPVSWPST